jgi:hypothetical protein
MAMRSYLFATWIPADEREDDSEEDWLEGFGEEDEP